LKYPSKQFEDLYFNLNSFLLHQDKDTTFKIVVQIQEK